MGPPGDLPTVTFNGPSGELESTSEAHPAPGLPSEPHGVQPSYHSCVMAYDQRLADEIRSSIGVHPGLTEREMFGGIAFMINGNMAVGVSGDELMVRVGKEAHDEMVSRPGARPFDMGSRPMRGWLSVGSDGIATAEDLHEWVAVGVAYAGALPKK